MDIPNTYTTINETGCCAIPNVDAWQDKVISFEDKPFIRMQSSSIMFVPTNLGKIMTRIQETAATAHATPPSVEVMTLSRDLSPWKAEQLYAVTKAVDGASNVVLSGTFATKVFEGDYKNAKDWYTVMEDYAKLLGHEAKEVYFFYTTCPKCAKHYGKNYTIGLAKLD
jgi:hypothetical protein